MLRNVGLNIKFKNTMAVAVYQTGKMLVVWSPCLVVVICLPSCVRAMLCCQICVCVCNCLSRAPCLETLQVSCGNRGHSSSGESGTSSLCVSCFGKGGFREAKQKLEVLRGTGRGMRGEGVRKEKLNRRLFVGRLHIMHK